ncbi:MAG: hypothetical protein WC314_14755 [Vulcanimicrobiota bacterium]
MDETLAFRCFHQGTIRVTDGVPFWDGQRSYPVPASWHHPKEDPDAPAQNFSIKSPPSDTQYKGHKAGWFTPNLQRVSLTKNFTIRTAVDGTGKARQGLLYGIPTLVAGARFVSRIEGPEADLSEIRHFVDRQEFRLGRSRNSELGLVKVHVREQAPKELQHGTGQTQRVSFLCVSRCIFRDPDTGAPTIIPEPEVLGLPKHCNFEPAFSFVRTTRIVHFNNKRARPENERFAVERGSVLTFTSTKAISLTDVVKSVRPGVGEFCGQGYGDVLVNPEWLTGETFSFAATEKAPSAEAASPPNDELFQWASDQAVRRRQKLEYYETASQKAHCYRKYKIPPSQWGAIRGLARQARFTDSEALLIQLFGSDGSSGFLNDGSRRLSESWKRARSPLYKLCKKQTDLPVFLELLASACMRPHQDSRNGGEE